MCPSMFFLGIMSTYVIGSYYSSPENPSGFPVASLLWGYRSSQGPSLLMFGVLDFSGVFSHDIGKNTPEI